LLDLTLIKQNGGTYIDSREVALAIGKRHDHLLRDIGNYLDVIDKFIAPNFGGYDFFLESSYSDLKGRARLCYLVSKMGCEMVANRLTGERGIMFTAAYVAKFNEMEASERESEIKARAKPRLGEFNSAVRNVLSGMAYCITAPARVMGFLRKAYEPFGIEVLADGTCDRNFFTVTEIAEKLGLYSETGRPHGHAVSAIISKFDIPANHAVAIPYGLVGVSIRYDRLVIKTVAGWIHKCGFPSEVPYNGFDYHVYYNREAPFYHDGEYFVS